MSPPTIQGSMLNAGFRPFTPRVVELGYVAPKAGPRVFLTSDAGSGQSDVLCGPDYPYDPRNMSLAEVFWNEAAVYTYVCDGLPPLLLTVMANTFYSIISDFEAQQLACEAAAAKAQSKGYTCAICLTGALTTFDLIPLTTFSGEPLTLF